MKDVELKFVSELMKNSHGSDRELTRTLGISQPTVSTMRTKLEEEGHIREYSIIPDFAKLAFAVMSVTFSSLAEYLATSGRNWEEGINIE